MFRRYRVFVPYSFKFTPKALLLYVMQFHFNILVPRLITKYIFVRSYSYTTVLSN